MSKYNINVDDNEFNKIEAIISSIGMLVGSLWNKKRYKQNK